MSRAGQERLINTILYGSVAAVLIFFYIPIVTLIGFSFQEGRYLVLPFSGLSLQWYGELFRNGNAATALWNST
ncbi:MAG TPA: ABC transporter permease, partial [Dongiaceae bacterium]|nr:ABC transporter permease [Dongiaceae bacterium]